MLKSATAWAVVRSVALATWSGLPDLTDDDRELVRALDDLDIEAVPAIWSDPGVDWGRFDAVVLRSTWDYYRRIEEFRRWVDRVGTVSLLWNPPGTVRWNSHKSYLKYLERAGVSIVPTRVCSGLRDAATALREERWERAVVKPAVSAGGYRTYFVDTATFLQDPSRWANVAEGGELLVQPYQEAVERDGERSLVFLGGEYSHAFLRAPHFLKTSRLVEGTPAVPAEREIRAAHRALTAAPGPVLYGRVDLVPAATGEPRVMELEVIEPALGLKTAEGAGARFAAALRGVL